jgi:hypothetical protein
MAFFPLFPFVWKITGLNAIGISLLNLLIFSIAYYFICLHLRLSIAQRFLFLSTPSLLFCMVPYSESIFFLGGTLLLLGLERRNNNMIIIGLAISALSRSIGLIFIPAISITVLHRLNIKNYIQLFKKTFYYVSTIVISSLLVFIIQYLYTGKWLVFFYVQKFWNRQLQIPTLPLTTFTNFKMLWLDGLALFVCSISLIFLIFFFYNYFIRKSKIIKIKNNALFSFIYIASAGVVSVIFSGVWSPEYGTALMSLNRFIFATPYFIFVIVFLSRYIQASSKDLFVNLFIIMSIVWLLLGAYRKSPDHNSYFETFGYFCRMSFIILLYYLSISLYKRLAYVIYIINIIAMTILFHKFILGGWVA